MLKIIQKKKKKEWIQEFKSNWPKKSTSFLPPHDTHYPAQGIIHMVDSCLGVIFIQIHQLLGEKQPRSKCLAICDEAIGHIFPLFLFF